ncbi:MAG: response regulator [Myxococcaceae bacterium]
MSASCCGRAPKTQRGCSRTAASSWRSRCPKVRCTSRATPNGWCRSWGTSCRTPRSSRPRGGRVNLSLRQHPEEDTVQVQVRDTGVGIAPEVLEHLFEPFVQGDGSLARTRGGLGLGLALVKGLVDLHGGTVRASSAGLGKGAELTVELPSAAAPGVQTAAPVVSAASMRRVLVVEDNRDAAQTLREVLELGGHVVKVAHDGREALTVARGWVPDLLLCDIGLPHMDGYEVAQAFGADRALNGVYLVALSGYAQPEDQRRAKEAGFHEHLPKPPDLQAIEGLLSRVPSGVAPAA